MSLEFTGLSGEVVETKQETIDGVEVGIVTGHIATWQADHQRGIYGVPDRIIRGAYTESIQEHKARQNRPVRLKDHHMNTIGGFPIKSVREDSVGLYAEGHINLETQQGQEAYSLARQGVLSDFSVGHIVQADRIENGERLIEKARLIEGSIVDEPKNRRSRIIEVKAESFTDLPVAAADYKWDEDEARGRIMELKFGDGNAADVFIQDHLIGDVIDGKLTVVPAAVKIAAQHIDTKSAQAVLEQYFAKMDIPSPFDTSVFYTAEKVGDMSNAELKAALLDTGCFSNGAAKAIVARKARREDVPTDEKVIDLGPLLEGIRGITPNSNQRG